VLKGALAMVCCVVNSYTCSAMIYQETELDIRTVTSVDILPVSRQSSATNWISSRHDTPARSLE